MASHELEGTLFSAKAIEKRVKGLAQEIAEAYKGTEKITLLVVLKGAFMFAADLAREINAVKGAPELEIEFVKASSYGQETVSSGEVNVELRPDVKGKHVLIVEDIIDTGRTLKKMREIIEEKTASVKICTLLDKKERREVEVAVEFVGFEIPNKFVVGYGIDCAEEFRELPFVATVKE